MGGSTPVVVRQPAFPRQKAARRKGVGIGGPVPTGDLMSRVYAGPRRYPAPGTSRDAYQKSPQLPSCRTFAIQVQRAAAVASAATAPGRRADPRAAPLRGRGLCGHRDDRYGLPGPRALRPPGRPVRTPGAAEPVREPRDGPVRAPGGSCRGEACGGAGTLIPPGVRLPPPAAPRRSRAPQRDLRQERTTSSHTTVSISDDEEAVFRGPAVGRPHAALRPRRCGCPATTSGAHFDQPRDRRAGTAPAAHPGIPAVRITTSESGVRHARTAEGDRDPPLRATCRTDIAWIPDRRADPAPARPGHGRPHGISSEAPAPPGDGRSATVPDVQSGPHHSSRTLRATHRWVAEALVPAAAYPFRGGREGRSSIRLMWASFG